MGLSTAYANLALRPIQASSLPSLQQMISPQDFFDAVDSADLRVIMEFVQGGGDINIKNATMLGFSALFLTISHGPIGKIEAIRLAIFNYLLGQENLNIQSAHCSMGNGLNYSVMFKREELIQPLIDSGIEIDYRGSGGATPLWQACDYGYLGIAIILLANRANPNVLVGSCPRSSMSCLGVVIHKKNIPLLKCLLSKTNLDVNQQYSCQRSSRGVCHLSNALHQAFENDFFEAIPELIAAGAFFDPNLTYRGLEEISPSLYQQEFPLKAKKSNKYIDAVNRGFVLKERRTWALIDHTKISKKAFEERDKVTYDLVKNLLASDKGVASIICSY